MNFKCRTQQTSAKRLAKIRYAAAWHRQRGQVVEHRQRLTASATADTAVALLGSLGIVGGTLFAALYVVERQSKEVLHRKVERLEETIRQRDQQLSAAVQEAERAKEHAQQNEMFRTRYADAARDIFKLERALELKDGQMESFMVVAQRQIAYLESQMRELQKAGE